MKLSTVVLLTVFLAITITAPARASFHLMQIHQVIGGVDGDVTVQAVQLRMRSSFQTFVSFSRVVAWDANSLNPIIVSDPAVNMSVGGAGATVLIASANFAAHTSPPAVPDIIMDNLIPASYLNAGSLTFENSGGTIIYWRLSWGGASYTGSTTGSITNDVDGQFGPAFGGEIPTSAGEALRFQGSATAASTNNAADYALTSGNAVFTNNTGQSFTIESVPTGIRPQNVTVLGLRNQPNPFNPSTQILFAMPETGAATLQIFDARGNLVITLLDGHVPMGNRRVRWNGRDTRGRPVVSGMYFYRLVTASSTETRKMMLLK